MGRSRGEIEVISLLCFADAISANVYSGCTLHLPWSLFSDAQMDTIRWEMEMFGVNNLPLSAVMKEIDQVLQMSCGIDTIQYKGAFGHPYYVNHLGSIIAQVESLDFLQ